MQNIRLLALFVACSITLIAQGQENAISSIQSRLASIDPLSKEPASYFIAGTILQHRNELILSSDNRMIIILSANARLLVKPDGINANSVSPLRIGEDRSGRGSQHRIELLSGTEVELVVGAVTKSFRLSWEERQFYVDEERETVVYLDELDESERAEWNNCYKRVYVADCYCCRNNKFRKACYGWVGCPNPGDSGWYDSKCCP